MRVRERRGRVDFRDVADPSLERNIVRMHEMQDLARSGQRPTRHHALNSDTVYGRSRRELAERSRTHVAAKLVDRANDALSELSDQREVLSENFQFATAVEIYTL